MLFTQAGLLLVDQARTVLREVKDAQRKWQVSRGEIRPAAYWLIPAVGPYLLPHFLSPPMLQTFPKLEMYLHEAQTHQLLAQLDSGKLDCAILALVKSEAFIEMPAV